MKLMMIDGNSIVNRAFYGVRQLNAPDGTPTNAVYGFLAILNRLTEELKPEALCVSFDLKAPTFRHKAYEAYKANRKGMPEELAVQMPLLKQVIDAMGIKRYEKEGYEADDILGTAARICEEKGWECIVVTGDKDSLQLVSDSTTVCNVKTRMGQTETVMYTPERFREEYGFEPKGIVDLKALMGDTSDNIPGVAHVGEKTALELIRRFGSVEAIYSGLDTLDIRDSVRKNLAAGEESARKSYWLATILREVPMEFVPEDNIYNNEYSPELYGIFKRLGFNKFIEKWGLAKPDTIAKAAPAASVGAMKYISSASAEQLISAVKKAERVAVMCGDGLDSIELCDGEAVYSASWSQLGEEWSALLAAVFSPEVKKLSHNVKDLMGQLLSEGLSVEGFAFDTALAAYLLEATESDYSLPRISVRYLGRECGGTEAIFALCPVLDAKMRELDMDKLYYETEMPLCEVLADMEKAGFLVDRHALSEFGESLNDGISLLQQNIWLRAGHEFNINSPKQLGTVLFDELMLPSGKKTKTGWSTNADVLEKLRGKHAIVDDILEYRMLTKLKSTYADGLLKVIAPDGRIHTSFQMTVTATGRLSSTEPNLQNIPIRKKLGAEIRRMFVAAPGKVLVDADYSQIELRLLAHISGDKAMREAFLSGEDFHTVTAAKVFDLPVSEVTPSIRSRAKAVNFGIVYGISAFSLGQDIGTSTAQAQRYMDAYLDKYRGVRDYMKSIVERAKTEGFVATLYGRRRYLPEIKSANFNMRSFGERVALNMPVQGTAADVIKIAMVRVFRELRARGLEARLILQVHDELIVECPEAEAEEVRALLAEEMRRAADFTVPLIAEANIGHSWADAH